MNAHLRVLGFGAFSGVIWLVAPLFFTDFHQDGSLVVFLLAGVLTGIATSLIVAGPVRRSGFGMTLLAGLLALPLGAFVYGVIVSTLHWLIQNGEVGIPFDPIVAGYWFMVYASLSLLSVVFYPASVTTTFLLQRVVRSA